LNKRRLGEAVLRDGGFANAEAAARAVNAEPWDLARRAPLVRAFTVKQRNARIGRNPRTGETVRVYEGGRGCGTSALLTQR
jgi:hypothetical protein